MTNNALEPSIDPTTTVLLHDPGAVAASLPHLLGFHPVESLVCLWLSGGRLVVSQRADLPSQGAHAADDYAAAFFATAQHVPADAAICVIVTRHERMIQGLRAAIAQQLPVECRAILQLHGSQVRDLREPDGDWTWIDARSRQWAAQRFPDSSPALSRTRIETECDADEAAYEEMGELCPDPSTALPSTALPSTALARMRDFVDHVMSQTAHGQQVDARPWPHVPVPKDRLLRDACLNSVGRDLLLLAAANLPARQCASLLESLLRCTRATPPGHAGNVAAAAGVVAWLCGDGVRANVALERCLLDDPGNVLGILLEDTVRTGVPPQAVRALLADVPVLDIVPS